jgi:transposase
MGESKEAGKAEICGEFLNTEAGVKKLIKKLNQLSEKYTLEICYEAGPCGFALKRILDKQGFYCEIVAPSLIPQRAGNKIKTDKRDAKKLARLFRAGELTFITVPDEGKESARDLVRCREDMMNNLKRTKQRLNHFLMRHGYHYHGSNWTIGHFKWLQQIELKDTLLDKTMSFYLNEINYLVLQLKDMDKEIHQLAETKRYKEKVDVLCAYRGIGVLTAMILITEIIDFKRFRDPRELMAYLGMVPSEYSSGSTVKKGSITKCGNKRARRALVEAAHHSRHKPVITITMKNDLQKIREHLRMTPVKAMKRLHSRYYHLLFKGKITQVAVVAVARELAGFIWHSMVMLETAESN